MGLHQPLPRPRRHIGLLHAEGLRDVLREPGIAEKIIELGGHAPNYPLPGPCRRELLAAVGAGWLVGGGDVAICVPDGAGGTVGRLGRGVMVGVGPVGVGVWSGVIEGWPVCPGGAGGSVPDAGTGRTSR